MHPAARSSARLALRETDIGDVDAVHAIYGNAEATRHLSFEPRTRDEVYQIVARSVASAAAEPRMEYGLAVVERDTQHLVGGGGPGAPPPPPPGGPQGGRPGPRPPGGRGGRLKR
ncbi:GNAT family N-acetyltransferase, partial [Streptomyces sp. NPDC056337]|uniref:GNAT family N-acetyltransferase n=1 Tax=Streptomyces sp. NPDC056337 TaxID=3345787 RepID=UPI0035D5E338